jgi:phenylalanyl-tRNA synthetase beta chain
MKAAEDVLAVLVAALSDLGGNLESIEVKYQNCSINTPDLTPQEMSIDPSLTNNLLGLDLNISEIIECLQKSRISGVQNEESVLVEIPRYRSDILHPVDIIEEVALGFNIGNITPTLPTTSAVGNLDDRLAALDSMREVLIGLGLIEVINFSLISRELLKNTLEHGLKKFLQVENPKSSENEFLRNSLIPSIINTFGRNIHEEYPQKIFEIGKIFDRNNDDMEAVKEDYHLAVGIAHGNTNYTEIKSYLTSFLKTVKGLDFETFPRDNNFLIPGRSAEVVIEEKNVGIIGELSPEILEKMNLRMPISIFEINLELL